MASPPTGSSTAGRSGYTVAEFFRSRESVLVNFAHRADVGRRYPTYFVPGLSLTRASPFSGESQPENAFVRPAQLVKQSVGEQPVTFGIGVSVERQSDGVSDLTVEGALEA